MMMNESEKLHRIVYVSTSLKELSVKELEDILSTSRRNNSLKNITGVLIYCDGNILQVLEGNKKDVHQLYGQISQDKRHFGCIILQDTPSESRSFAEWSMAFKQVTNIEFLQLEGYWDLRTKHLPLINDNTEYIMRNLPDVYVEHNQNRY
jgi:hypothetical protein